jgi:hypothetical protein
LAIAWVQVEFACEDWTAQVIEAAGDDGVPSGDVDGNLLRRHVEQGVGRNIAEHVGDRRGHPHFGVAERDERTTVFGDRLVVRPRDRGSVHDLLKTAR